jgi:hypothetical protein
MDPAARGARPPGGGAGLVGRARELAILRARLDALEEGRGALLVLTGEPGIGKTRLCQAAAEEARGRGLTVLRGAAWDGGGAPSYWPWIEVVRALRPGLAALEEGLRRDLGPLWDEGAAAGPAPQGGPDAELLRFRRLDALRTLLAAASARRGVVVVLEDLHAADPGSLEALLFLARALHEQRTLVLATWRPPEEAVPLAVPLLVRIAAGAAEVLRPARLGPDDVAALLGALEPVPGGLAEELHRRSGGNPLFVEELVRRVRAGGGPGEVPARVTALIAGRLARLDGGARAVLEAAAVLGAEVAADPLAEVVGGDPGEVRALLARLAGAGVVEPAAAGVRLAHPLYREHLLAELGPARAAAIHLAAAAVLERRAATGEAGAEEAIALHLLAAQPAGDAGRAEAWALRAAAAASRGFAYARAAELLEAALRILDRSGSEPGHRIDVQLLLVEALARGGAPDRARAVALDAAARARALADGERLARSALAYGAELRVALVDPALVALLREALQLLPAAAPALRARVMARLGAALQPADDPQVPMALAREAVAVARTLDDPEVLRAVLHAAGAALASYAPPAERLQLSRSLVELATRGGDLVQAQQGMARVAVDVAELGDLPGAEAAAAAHERLGIALGHPRWRWRAPLLRSMCALARGRWDAAAQAQAEAAGWAEHADDPAAAPTLLIHRLAAQRVRGAGSEEDVRAVLVQGPTAMAPHGLMSALMPASMLARRNRLDLARRALEAAPELSGGGYFPYAVVTLADVVMRVGDRRRAAELLPWLLAMPGPALTTGAVAYVWDGPIAQWTGGILAVLERWDAAVRALEAGLALAQDVDARPAAAELSCALGRVLARRGRRGDGDRARALLDGAEREAEALAMPHLGERIAAARGEVPRTAVPGASRAPSRSAPGLAREGDVWAVTFGERTVRVKGSRGLELLARLVAEPGREFRALELAGGAGPEGPLDPGDAGEALDARARDDYRRRARELEVELGEAERWHDLGRAERARAEIEFLRGELARGLSLGGRPRREASAAERARVNVQKRLRGAVRRIAAALPELGAHLEASVRTGAVVSYRAADPGHDP